MSLIHRVALASAACLATLAAAGLAIAPAAGAQARTAGQAHGQQSFISHFHKISTIVSTVPGNGDVNPYGVAVVGRSQGILKGGRPGQNFNNKANLQGTGTTIVEVSPGGAVSPFARISARHLPGRARADRPHHRAVRPARRLGRGRQPAHHQRDRRDGQGRRLLVLNSWGHVRETFSGRGINGPWDMTAVTTTASPGCSSPTS